MAIPLDIGKELRKRIVGQSDNFGPIVEAVEMHRAGLSEEDRPVGVFLLVGPTGTGKSHTAAMLADILHNDPKKVFMVHCGEFQADHEVAKLIGAPPGYLGHRETVPMINQQRLTMVASEQSNISILVFDEIEKAAPALTRLLLGVLDKAQLRLGDNTSVNFERTLVFLTSNLGAKEAVAHLSGAGFGFTTAEGDREKAAAQSEHSAVKRKFSPEFLNRIDAVITYKPLTAADLAEIFEQQLTRLQKHVANRIPDGNYPALAVTDEARQKMIAEGHNVHFGARGLKRVFRKYVLLPVARFEMEGLLSPKCVVRIEDDLSATLLEQGTGLAGLLEASIMRAKRENERKMRLQNLGAVEENE